MTMPVFVAIYIGAAGLLAFWFDLRFPKLRPASWRNLGFVVVAAFISDDLCTASLGYAPRLVGVIGVVLPAIAMTFLACIWMLRMMRSSMPS
jgi:hypothetical protein